MLAVDKEKSSRKLNWLQFWFSGYLEQTLERSLVVKSLILCLIDGKSPFGQDRACSTEQDELQVQLAGVGSESHAAI